MLKFSIKLLGFVLIYIAMLDCALALESLPENSIELTDKERLWLKSNATISVAFDGHFPPYSFIGDSGDIKGFSVDVFDAIADKLGINIEVYPDFVWKTLYEAAQQHKVDVVATMVHRKEREQWFDFTNIYIDKSLVIITNNSNTEINERNDLKNKKIVLVEGYQYTKSILKEFPSVQPLYKDTILDALNAVSVGNADAAITFLGSGQYYRNKYLLNNLKYAAVYDSNKSPERIAVRNDKPVLASILTKTLASISKSEMHDIRARWLPVDDDIWQSKLVNLTKEEQEWIREHKDIRLGIDPEFAPFEFMDNGHYSGIASDIISLLNKRLNLNMLPVEGLTWKQVIDGAKTGSIDVLPAVGKSSEREQFLDFSDPYIDFHRVIVTRSDAPFVMGLDDLKGMSLGVQVNTSHHGYLKEHTDLLPITYKTLEESLLALSGGKVDALVGNVASATYWINKLHLVNLKVAAPVSMTPQQLYFATRKDWPELGSILQKGLDSISPYQREEISKKWLSIEYAPFFDEAMFWKFFLAAIACLLLIMIWNFLLKRKVGQRTRELEYSAHYDRLTGLPNRFLMLDRFALLAGEAELSGFKVSMLSIDLNNFKIINDNFGHQAGDETLQETALRFTSALNGKGMLGRLEGDQFLVIASHISEVSDAAYIAESLLECLKQAYSIDGHEVILTASVGISIFPDDGKSPAELLKNADHATHHSKSKGRGLFFFYTKALNEAAERQLLLEEAMHVGFERGEFYVVYQPKVDAVTKQIISFEALLRWSNNQFGDVSPVEFIPIAEKNGLIEKIGLFVLENALKTLAQWQSIYGESLTMAVNLSPLQFGSVDLARQVYTIIRRVGVPTDTLELEITEGALLEGGPHVASVLRRFDSLGIKIAMDDFGTGYSSMSYLRKFKFDTLKIDQEFIIDITYSQSDQQLVSAAIAMGHSLGMKVVAEGVETTEQLDMLVDLGCDIIQGYLFGKPMLPEQIDPLLESQNNGLKDAGQKSDSNDRFEPSSLSLSSPA